MNQEETVDQAGRWKVAAFEWNNDNTEMCRSSRKGRKSHRNQWRIKEVNRNIDMKGKWGETEAHQSTQTDKKSIEDIIQGKKEMSIDTKTEY
eukprot:10164378-Ditylum_brightwellii.AAC.1